jgi:hypothetical protein
MEIRVNGKGFYKILSRENNKALTCPGNAALVFSDFSGKDNQVWKIENAYYGLYKISNKTISIVRLIGKCHCGGRQQGSDFKCQSKLLIFYMAIA